MWNVENGFIIPCCILGDSTPTQNWDDNEGGDDDDDMEIPSHLPPKQREMFMRIKQHTMKMKREKSELFQQQKKEESEPKSDIKCNFPFDTSYVLVLKNK